MLKKTITFTDYAGEERTEDFYFNLSRAELLEMEMFQEGGLVAHIERIVQAKDNAQIVELFKDLILQAYGEKSADGRRFMKDAEIVANFEQTEAYSELFVELATNEQAAIEFVNGIIPKDPIGGAPYPQEAKGK